MNFIRVSAHGVFEGGWLPAAFRPANWGARLSQPPSRLAAGELRQIKCYVNLN